MTMTMTNEQTDYDDLQFEIECPTCETLAVFHYVGVQTFPEAVAEQLGFPTEIHLWRCGNCHSTISHVDLGIEL